jgi:hypothetical protein
VIGSDLPTLLNIARDVIKILAAYGLCTSVVVRFGNVTRGYCSVVHEELLSRVATAPSQTLVCQVALKTAYSNAHLTNR